MAAAAHAVANGQAVLQRAIDPALDPRSPAEWLGPAARTAMVWERIRR